MVKLFQSLFFPALFTVLPATLSPSLLRRPEIWLAWAIGALAIWTQPKASYLPSSNFYADSRDKKSAFGIIVSIYSVGAGAIALFANEPIAKGSLSQAVGIVLGTLLGSLGLTLRVLAIKELGRMFTTQVQILDDHKLITGGPFRFVRHPSYLGAILAISAIPTVYAEWWWTGASLFILSFAYSYRIRVEESALSERFGDIYKKYQASVGMLFPKLFTCANPS